jgi:hypothetical protein
MKCHLFADEVIVWRCHLPRRMSPLLADIVAKVENRTTLQISRKLILDFSAAVSLFSAATAGRDRFWMKRYGPSRRRA